MRKQLLMTTAALLASTAIAAAQSGSSGAAGGGSSQPSMNQPSSSQPSAGQGSSSGGATGDMQRRPSAPDRDSGSRAQTQERGGSGQTTTQSRDQKSGDTMRSGQTDQDRDSQRSGQTTQGRDNERSGTSDRMQSQEKNGTTTRSTETQSKSGGRSVSLTSEQRTKISQTIKTGSVNRVSNVDFNINVGTAVPRDKVKLVTVPSTIVEIQPAWRGYLYFVVEDQIVIVEPDSYEIVAVIPA